MKVVVWDDLPEGGAKRVVFEQIKGLSKLAQIEYITNQVKSTFAFNDYVTGFHRFDMSLDLHKGLTRPFQELSFITKVLPEYRKMVRLISNLKPDLVLAHPSMVSQASWIMTMLEQPVVYFAHEWPRVVYEPEYHPLPHGIRGWYELWRRQAVGWVDKRAVAAASEVVTTSTYLERSLSKIYDRKFNVIHPGVDLNTFSPPKRRVNKNYFLFMGNREAISGYLLLDKVINMGYKVKVVELGAKGFSYLETEIVQFYRGAIATLCLSENEPFGLAAIESMACETPVIAVKTGGHTDTVVDGETGLLIKPDERELIKAMQFCKRYPVKMKQMGKQGRVRMRNCFSWKTHTEKLVDILERLR
jgi:glycosyltransferase involved in cell wall biosynthesis